MAKLLKNCESLKNIEERNNFEDKVEKIIKECLDNYDSYKIKYINKNYNQINLNKDNPKIILNELVPIEEYSENEYPLFKYFMNTKYPDENSFRRQIEKIDNKYFNNKYPLISQLLLNNSNIEKLKYLPDINEFSNFMLDNYSNKITKGEAKTKKLSDENLLNDKVKIKLNKFIKSWDAIKDDTIFYKNLRRFKVKELSENDKLIFFLNDDKEFDNSIYISAAYQNFIYWQNGFLQPIIDCISEDGLLYFYLNNLKNKISVQDANDEQILSLENIDLENIIFKYTKRDIFIKEGKINYLNYNSFIYDFDLIEKELGKLILSGKCLFKKDTLRFISYNFDINSEITIFNNNYPQIELYGITKEKIYNYFYKKMKGKSIYFYKNFFNYLL